VLRTAIADAAGTVPGTDPDRASFAVALNAARDQVILAAGVLAAGVLAAGVLAGTVTDLAGTIGRLVLASLMPSRRLRTSPRAVKRAMSKYNAKGKVDRTTRKATIAITILAGPLDSQRRTLTNGLGVSGRLVTDGDGSAVVRHAISADLGGSLIAGLVADAAPER